MQDNFVSHKLQMNLITKVAKQLIGRLEKQREQNMRVHFMRWKERVEQQARMQNIQTRMDAHKK